MFEVICIYIQVEKKAHGIWRCVVMNGFVDDSKGTKEDVLTMDRMDESEMEKSLILWLAFPSCGSKEIYTQILIKNLYTYKCWHQPACVFAEAKTY